MPTVASLHVYPIKGLRGIDLTESAFDARGLTFDRRWMLVDESGVFLSQRSIPRMCLFRTSLAVDGIRVSTDGDDLLVPLEPKGERLTVRIWRDDCEAARVSDQADDWFSSKLGLSARLVFMPDETRRQTNLDFTQPGDQVGFADAFPILFASEASLADLNGRLPEAIPMNRFRPNIVLTGTSPFEEDTWPRFELSDVPFRFAKLCGRCQVTTTNQDTAEVGKEPLRTLATYRREGNTVLFGAYHIPEGGGTVRIGDEVNL